MITRSLVAVFAMFVLSSAAQTSLPFRYRTNFLTGLTAPIYITHAGDGTRRLFIVEQGGVIKVLRPGFNTPTVFMDITSRVIAGGERGLLGLAFHPNFETNSYFFVNYTRQTDGATIVSRFKAINNNSIGDANSERIVIGPISQPDSTHNGGMIEFREDAPGVHNMYIGMGDGGPGNDPFNRAQNINELLGKFLRITPDVSGNDANPAYTIPADNPFVGVAGLDEIFAVGFRNPWRWSFDRGGTRQLWAGDVGQNQREEADIVSKGANYGWRVYEGTSCTGIDPGFCNPGSYTMPIFEYSHQQFPSRCAVTGGYVYRGKQRALNTGTYVYGDYCTGEILKWEANLQSLLLDTNRNFGLVSFGEDQDGELYVVSQSVSGGAVDKIMGNRTSADFDGDLKADRAVFRPSNLNWYIINSGDQSTTITRFGLSGDIPTPEDYDGDGRTDLSVFRPSTGQWFSIWSSDFTYRVESWGQSGDTPQPGDYDADGRADLAVFRGANGNWFVKRTDGLGTLTASWGLPGDIPVAGDYDGDYRFDFTVWRPSNGKWYRINSTNNFLYELQWGLNNDIPAPADFDGDGRRDLSIFRPSTGEWHILLSANNQIVVRQWGLNGDVPVASDYDGDGRDDRAVFRPSDGKWYVLGSSIGINVSHQWGLPGDLPIPKYDTP